MELQWTSKAHDDLSRLYIFLARRSPWAAARVVQSLVKAPTRLTAQPRIGEKLEEFEPREVRRLFVGRYELRYEIQLRTIYVLRLWRARERR
ncbi:MAG: type II toxin-antitoxin system RelE/ParE family toxin [Elusimicrobiota bacterium]|nr:type II toxin-antitoxin system RelE/ParE family toxin [Elusimicrobiota bacterium]